MPLPATRTRPFGIALRMHRRPLVPGFRERTLLVENPKMLQLEQSLVPLAKPERPDPKAMGVVQRVKTAPGRWVDTAKGGFMKENLVHLIYTPGKVGAKTFILHRDGWQWQPKGIDRLLGVKQYV